MRAALLLLGLGAAALARPAWAAEADPLPPLPRIQALAARPPPPASEGEHLARGQSALPSPAPGAARARPGSTALVLQLASSVKAPARALAALAQGLEGAGETVVVVPEAPSPDCPGKPDCVERVVRAAGAQRVLFIVLVGLGEEVQIAATRARPGQPPEDLPPVLVDAGELEPALKTQGATWARPVEAPEPLAVTGEGPSPPVIALGSLAAAALGAGAILGAVALGTRSGLEADGCLERVCAPGRVDALEREALAADLAFATAGVSAVIGAVLWLTERP